MLGPTLLHRHVITHELEPSTFTGTSLFGFPAAGRHPLEPRITSPYDPVNLPFGNNQMGLGIVIITLMYGQGIGQFFLQRDFPGKSPGQIHTLPIGQFPGQGQLQFTKQTGIGPFVPVCKLPVNVRIVLGKAGYDTG